MVNNENKKTDDKNIVSEVFSDYCTNSSIHGISYLGTRDSTFIEKIWWSVVFIISLAACMFLITKTWTKWQENPVIVSFSQEQTSVWEIPFPAITICPTNKVRLQNYNYTNEYHNRKTLKGNSYKKFWDVSLVCETFFHDLSKRMRNFTDEDAVTHIKEVAPQIGNIFGDSIFKGERFITEYSDLFVNQLTAEGICFTFNSLGQHDMYSDQIKQDVTFIDHNRNNTGWTIEEGYYNDDLFSFPYRTPGEGLESGLKLDIYTHKVDRDYVCSGPVTGYKVILHNPAEMPKVHQQYFLIPTNKQVTVAINPNVITTSKGLLNILPEVRNCYFAHEKRLRFFQVYTQNNCLTECLTNLTKVSCDCLPFYSPRDNETNVCAKIKQFCLKRARALFLEYENLIKKPKIEENIQQEKEFQIFEKCRCLPACASIDYNVQISQSEYELQEWQFAFFNKRESKIKTERTLVNFFFKESQFLALHRSELYGQTDFLANVGGLLGLFMGFSVLSLLEIIYFATLRTWCKLYRKKKNICTE